MDISERLRHCIRDVHDYPKAGIVFKDITPVLADPALVQDIIARLASDFGQARIDAIAATEARGFIFGAMLAHALKCKFIPVRKAGKLPYKTRKKSYDLEYGTATVEMHEDAVTPGSRVLIHDDLLATGGTASATASLVKELGGNIAGFSFIINLSFLPGEQLLKERFGLQPQYLVKY